MQDPAGGSAADSGYRWGPRPFRHAVVRQLLHDPMAEKSHRTTIKFYETETSSYLLQHNHLTLLLTNFDDCVQNRQLGVFPIRKPAYRLSTTPIIAITTPHQTCLINQ